MKNKREWGRVLKFTLFSISAGAIEMASFALLNELLHGSYWPCYLIALTLSVLWNFTLNRKFTFQSANNVPQAMAPWTPPAVRRNSRRGTANRAPVRRSLPWSIWASRFP